MAIARIHHFGIHASDVARSAQVYREALGLDLAAPSGPRPSEEVTMVGGSGEGHLQLHQPTQTSSASSATRYGIDHVHYETEDFDSALETLRTRGVEVTRGPADGDGARMAGFMDPEGLAFELIWFDEARRPRAASPSHGNWGRARWQHISMVVPDLRRAQRFYVETLGLKVVYEFTKNDGGFVLLGTDAFGGHEEFLLEIIGPPGLEPREERMLNELGPCYDHCCVEIADVEEAWHNAVRLGMEAVSGLEPRHYPEYPADIGWIRDPDGVDVEIMSSSTTRHVLDRFRRGERGNAWVESPLPLA
jgi:catechol 2,3-dioxygenase-like lactoylglutathione lyase family enzyme